MDEQATQAHWYVVHTYSGYENKVATNLEKIVEKNPEIIEIHGFMVYEEKKIATFDIIVDFDSDREKVKEKVLSEITSKHPQFKYILIDDYDVSD